MQYIPEFSVFHRYTTINKNELYQVTQRLNCDSSADELIDLSLRAPLIVYSIFSDAQPIRIQIWEFFENFLYVSCLIFFKKKKNVTTNVSLRQTLWRLVDKSTCLEQYHVRRDFVMLPPSPRLSFCMQNEERFGAAPPEIIQFDHAWKLPLAESTRTRASAVYHFLFRRFLVYGKRKKPYIYSSVLIKIISAVAVSISLYWNNRIGLFLILP